MARDYLPTSTALHRQHGDTVFLRYGWLKQASLAHPDAVREVLVDRFDDFIRWERGTEVFAQIHGQSVLVTEGDTWREQRRVLQPGFGISKMPGYAVLMRAAIDDAFADLDRQLQRAGTQAAKGDGAHTPSMDGFLTKLTMDVIVRALFSSRAGDDALQLSQAVQALGRGGMREMFLPRWMVRWLPWPWQRETRRARELLRGYINKELAVRRELIRQARQAHAASRRSDPLPMPQDLLQMLIEQLAQLSDQRSDHDPLAFEATVADQCMTTFLAGHETSAAALIWWVLMMAAHPEQQARAAHEVDTVLQGRPASWDDMRRLPFLSATLAETLRLYPSAPVLFTRRAVRDTQIGPYRAPKGLLVLLTPWLVHRDPRWFDQPEQFVPQRHLDHAAKRGLDLAFGAGPRVCIGKMFAQVEMLLTAATMLQKYRLHLLPGHQVPAPDLQVTLRPKLEAGQGLPVGLVRR